MNSNEFILIAEKLLTLDNDCKFYLKTKKYDNDIDIRNIDIFYNQEKKIIEIDYRKELKKGSTKFRKLTDILTKVKKLHKQFGTLDIFCRSNSTISKPHKFYFEGSIVEECVIEETNSIQLKIFYTSWLYF